MLKTLGSLLCFAIFFFILIVGFRKPSNDREWTEDLERTPGVSVIEEGERRVVIENVRDSSYENGEENISYYSEEYAPEDLVGMWFLVEPFSKFKAAAHTFFIFDFKDGETLGFSVEARKEKDEKYSALRGLFREYELHYLYGSERDLILRRTDFLDHDVYMYKIKTSQENLESLFMNIAKEAERLESEPAFYHTLKSSCTTTLAKHVNETSRGKIEWWRPEQYLPGLSDRLAFELGLIDTDVSFEETRERANITKIASGCADREDFSLCLREGLE